MNKKKIDAYLQKEMKKMKKDLKKEKARCAKTYPDWRDDEFNLLDNRFIWGYNVDKTKTPSFYSWDDAYIYYNRVTKKYYMTIDTGFYGMEYDSELARTELRRLAQIDLAFRDFLIKNRLPILSNIFPFDDPALEADSLSDLYFKFRIMIEGYKQFVL